MSGLTITHSNGNIIVWLSENEKDVVNTIIHESVHVFQKVMEFIQEDAPGTEVEAYSIAEIACNLLGVHLKGVQNSIHEKRPEGLQT
jgi:hypothetical protein